MRIVSEKTLKSGVRRFVVEVKEGEVLQNIFQQTHYRLGYPVEDVVSADVILHSKPVSWCSVEQQWVD